MIVADASALIAHLEAGDTHHDATEKILLELADHALVASPITLAEVLVGPARGGRLEEARTALKILDVRELPLQGDAAGRLATLRAETGLKLPDCCVILAAQDSSASGLVTFDERLAVAAMDLGLTTYG